MLSLQIICSEHSQETEITTLHMKSKENKHNSTTVICSSNAVEAEQNQETKKLLQNEGT